MMTIPRVWLSDPITLAEAEDDIADGMPADIWLSQWRALLGRFTPGDELWTYAGAVRQLSESGSESDLHEEWHGGFALVRDGKILDSIEAPWLI